MAAAEAAQDAQDAQARKHAQARKDAQARQDAQARKDAQVMQDAQARKNAQARLEAVVAERRQENPPYREGSHIPRSTVKKDERGQIRTIMHRTNFNEMDDAQLLRHVASRKERGVSVWGPMSWLELESIVSQYRDES